MAYNIMDALSKAKYELMQAVSSGDAVLTAQKNNKYQNLEQLKTVFNALLK